MPRIAFDTHTFFCLIQFDWMTRELQRRLQRRRHQRRRCRPQKMYQNLNVINVRDRCLWLLCVCVCACIPAIQKWATRFELSASYWNWVAVRFVFAFHVPFNNFYIWLCSLYAITSKSRVLLLIILCNKSIFESTVIE